MYKKLVMLQKTQNSFQLKPKQTIDRHMLKG